MKINKIILLGILILILLLSLNFVLGANVCCEKVKNGGFCENTDSANCETGLKNPLDATKGYWSSAATSCALTNFCRVGSCFNPNQDGLCYANYPKSSCEAKSGVFDASDPTGASSPQCQEGCCVIGSEASLTTEAKCKLETAKFPQLQMEFKTDINDEVQCVNIARQSEKGCCAKDPNTCRYDARSTCDSTQTTTTGFFSGKYCSELNFCNCVPSDPKLKGKGNKKDNTGCLKDSDDVYWKDSCGNPEGIAENCDYIKGNSCGDSDKDGVYTCESLNCDSNSKQLSLNLDSYAGSKKTDVESNGVLNGESWCLYDSPLQNKENGGGMDPVGSRDYRSVCINGKEVVEPCEDFRKEWCVDAPINIPSATQKERTEFFEAGCVENRVEDCLTSCNTLAFGSVDATKVGDVQAAFVNDFTCCTNTDVRDCKWIGPTDTNKVQVPAFGNGKFPPFCVPYSKPGTKFWESEGSDVCAKASLSCEVKFKCPGTGVLLGYLAGKECAGGKATRIGGKGKKAWEIVYGKECLKPEWIQAANDVCRSVGDCGADVNLNGKATYAGFSNTPSISHDFAPYDEKGGIGGKKVPGFLNPVLGGPGLGSYTNDLITNFKYNEKDQGALEKFFSGNAASSYLPLIFSGVYGVLGGLSATTNFANAFTGFSPLGGTKYLSNFFTGFKGAFFPSWFPKVGVDSAALISPAQTALTNAQTAYDTALKSYMADPSTVAQLDKASAALDSAENNLLDGTGSGAASYMRFINTAMWIWTAYNLINTYMAKEETVTITTTCAPWVAPVPTATGDICESCNPDEYIKDGVGGKTYTKLNALLKCSEYKCKSFGAACGIVNEGTDKQKCVNLNPHDTRSPLIDYWKEGTGKELDALKSSELPRVGVEFLKGEISAYQRVTVGIKTDEPSQCKMSFKNNLAYDKMEPFFFGDSIYEYFHTTILTYPNDVNSSDTTGGLKFGLPGQIYQLYVRCQDALGNNNEKDYVIKFKISKGPDITPPTIETTSLGVLPTERYLSLNANSTDINLFLNEAASCRWSNNDISYDSMVAENECIALNSNMNDGLYECKFMEQGKSSNTIGEPLKGFNDTEFKFYNFRCKDQPACVNGKTPEGKDCTRNINKQSSVLTLRKSYLLNLSDINPSGNIYIGGIGGNITLEARTQNGAEKTGKAFCGFTTTENQKNNVWGMTAFFNTNSSYHSQILSQLSTGTHVYYIGCADVAGNTVYGQTAFNLALDTEGPGIARAFIDSSSGTDIFKIRTDEKAVCEYSTTGTFVYGEGNAMLSDDGTTHSAQGGVNTYYVICEDQYNNRGSLVTINFLL